MNVNRPQPAHAQHVHFERSTDAVCEELGISEENLFVRVHRARKQLLS